MIRLDVNARQLKLPIALILFLFFNSTLSAQKCKYKEDKIDPMTDERNRLSYFRSKSFQKLGYRRKGEQYQFAMYIKFSGQLTFEVPKDEQLTLKLGNKKLINMTCSENVSPKTFVSNKGGVLTTIDVLFDGSKEQFEEISQHGIAVASVKINGSDFVWKFEGKEFDSSIQNAKCLVQN